MNNTFLNNILNHKLWIFKSIIFIILLFSISFAEKINFSASVDKNHITSQDIITYSVVIEGAKDFPNITKPNIKDFVIISGPSLSSNFSMINGSVSVSKTFSWRLAPVKSGDLVIEPIKVKYKRRTYTTEKIIVSVIENKQVPNNRLSSKKSPQTNNTKEILFLKATPSKSTVYKGEEIIVTYDLYYLLKVQTFNTDKLPDAKNFWVEQFPSNNRPKITREIVEGKAFNKATLMKVAYFPTNTGKLQIDPMHISCEIQVASKRSNSFFDDPFFSDSFFGNTEERKIKSNSIDITVLPFPEKNQPQNFNGLTGGFAVQSTIDTLKIKQDEAITLKYKISCRGNVSAVKIPSPDFPENVEVFDPKISKKINNKGNNIRGSLIYEYILIPREPGTLRIPALEFSYFDPERKKYSQVVSEKYTVEVLPKERKYLSSNIGLRKEEVSLLGKDIRFIDRKISKWYKKDDSVFLEFWFLAANIFSLLIILVSFGYKFWAEKMGTNVLFARKRRAWGKANERLKNAEKAFSDKNFDAMLTNLDHAVTGFISDKLEMAEAGIGTEEICQKLSQNNIDSELINKVKINQQNLELIRFTPGQIKENEIIEFINSCRNLLQELNRVI